MKASLFLLSAIFATNLWASFTSERFVLVCAGENDRLKVTYIPVYLEEDIFRFSRIDEKTITARQKLVETESSASPETIKEFKRLEESHLKVTGQIGNNLNISGCLAMVVGARNDEVVTIREDLFSALDAKDQTKLLLDLAVENPQVRRQKFVDELTQVEAELTKASISLEEMLKDSCDEKIRRAQELQERKKELERVLATMSAPKNPAKIQTERYYMQVSKQRAIAAQ